MYEKRASGRRWKFFDQTPTNARMTREAATAPSRFRGITRIHAHSRDDFPAPRVASYRVAWRRFAPRSVAISNSVAAQRRQRDVNANWTSEARHSGAARPTATFALHRGVCCLWLQSIGERLDRRKGFLYAMSPLSQAQLDATAVDNFREYLRIPSVQPDIDYGEQTRERNSAENSQVEDKNLFLNGSSRDGIKHEIRSEIEWSRTGSYTKLIIWHFAFNI